jgi:hypothetical protein
VAKNLRVDILVRRDLDHGRAVARANVGTHDRLAPIPGTISAFGVDYRFTACLGQPWRRKIRAGLLVWLNKVERSVYHAAQTQ